MKKGIPMRWSRWRSNERGVAMVTVLFIAAALTAVSSTAAFVTIQEFRSAGNDQRGAQALGYAESGIDRLMVEIRGGAWGWQDLMRSGCGGDLIQISGTVAGTNGTYEAELGPIGTCPAILPNPRDPVELAIVSIGEHPTAKRVVQQTIELRPKGLPIALYAESGVAGAGGVGNEAEVQQISLIVPGGNVENRDNIGFVGEDPYYRMIDFYGTGGNTPIPAAAHAAGDLLCNRTQNCGGSTREHFAPDSLLNCTANPRGDSGQSSWDGSANGGDTSGVGFVACHTAGKPPTSRFQWDPDTKERLAPNPELDDDDMRAMIQRAKASGVYCDYTTNPQTCTIAGGAPKPAPQNFTTNYITPAAGFTLADHYIAYFKFPEGNEAAADNNVIDWRAAISPLCGNNTSKSVVMLVPNGSVAFRGAGGGQVESEIAGAIFAEKGTVDVSSGITIHGTIIANKINMQAGASFLLDDCWIDNMPTVHMKVTPLNWAEIDS